MNRDIQSRLNLLLEAVSQGTYTGHFLTQYAGLCRAERLLQTAAKAPLEEACRLEREASLLIDEAETLWNSSTAYVIRSLLGDASEGERRAWPSLEICW